MKEVGGYDQLMNLPIPALREIVKCIEYFAKEEQKMADKAARRKK